MENIMYRNLTVRHAFEMGDVLPAENFVRTLDKDLLSESLPVSRVRAAGSVR